jgi:alginate O-acetyltransferase complex protein AlgJ
LKSQRKLPAIEDALLTISFLAAICMPVVGLTLRWHVMSEQEENRRLAEFPAPSASMHTPGNFPSEFTAYFNDNFGFRPTLIHLQSLAKLKLFGLSSSPQVIVGKKGWLYFSGEYSDKGKHLVPAFTQEQLEHWKLLLEGRRDWLARRGIRYLFTIFPRKEVIYPEYLPATFKPEEESRFDQLAAYFKIHSNLEILDLRPALYEAKARHDVYYQTDGHWNFYGGLTGSQAIIIELSKSFPQLKPVSESDCQVTTTQREGDLVKLLGLSGYTKEEMQDVSLREPAFKSILGPITVSNKPFSAGVTERKGASNMPRLVMFDDSAGSGMVPFLPQDFSRAVFVWLPRLDPVLIKTEHPDIVIQEMGELYLINDSMADLAELRDLELEGKGKAFKFDSALEKR